MQTEVVDNLDTAPETSVHMRSDQIETTSTIFPELTKYGNYENDKPLPAGLMELPADGTVRYIKKALIPFVPIVSVEWAYGSTYKPITCGYAIRETDAKRLAKFKSQRAPKRIVKPHPDLLLCIREASRAAHRERNAAQEAYQSSRHKLARNCKGRKTHWYALKDQGIVAAHKQGLVRYVGKTKQELAVYEYGEGGMSCFHSTLHPNGCERTLVEGHPEILQVETKAKLKGVSLKRVEITLDALPDDISAYERTAAPAMARSPLKKYRTDLIITAGQL